MFYIHVPALTILERTGYILFYTLGVWSQQEKFALHSSFSECTCCLECVVISGFVKWTLMNLDYQMTDMVGIFLTLLS